MIDDEPTALANSGPRERREVAENAADLLKLTSSESNDEINGTYIRN